MFDYHQQLEKAIEVISVESPTRYSWFGRPSPRLPRKLICALTSQQTRNYLLHDLAARLYNNFYLLADPTPSVPEENSRKAGPPLFVAGLSAANSGAGYWEEGWRVHTIQDDEVEVSRGNLRLCARRQDCGPSQNTPILPRATVQLRFPKEFLSMSPGFYMAVGDKPLGADPTRPMVRLYWNLTADGAAAFIRIATRLLNESSIAFRLKILSNPSSFNRCDAAVLYILKSDYNAVSEVLRGVYTDIGRHLKPGTPALTKQLGPGIGLAEDPGRGESFGQHRCRAVADAAIRAYEQGKNRLKRGWKSWWNVSPKMVSGSAFRF